MKQFYTYLCCIYGLLCVIPSFSQTNLVPNPSFEDTVLCPNNPGQLNYARFWVNPTLASPDYMNTCNRGQLGVPVNYIGVQNARTGNAYAFLGVYCFCGGSSNNYREYIQVPLNTMLLKGELYCIEFYVSLSNGLTAAYALNNIGAYFSGTAVSSTDKDPLPYLPQVVNPSSNPLTNVGVWTKVSGQFIAQGGEHYLTIGNFNDNATSDTVFIKNTITSSKEADYYIDDVSVMHIDADAGKDTAICKGNSIQIGRVTSAGITYSWQPATGLSSAGIAQPIATPTVTTTYYLAATLMGGCTKQDTVTITVVSADAGRDTALCEGSGMILGSASLKGVNYNWLPTEGLNKADIAQPIAIPATPTTYTLIATANGCVRMDTVNIAIMPYQKPISNPGIAQTICQGDTVSLGIAATPGYKFTWSPIFYLNNINSSQPFAFPKQTTYYALTVTDTVSNYLCKTSTIDSVLITVDECWPLLPNIFTPNGDGINDEFVLTNLTAGSSMRIYNRWGNEVISYKVGDISWDGRMRSGVACAEGIYYYIISVPGGKTYTGVIQLAR